MQEIDNPTGCQLTLIELPKRKRLTRDEWAKIELTRFGRAHQSYSAEMRQNARDFHRHMLTDRGREHPPIV